MSNPEQEQALSTIAALAHSLSGTKLTDVQLDLVMCVQNLMTNIAVQSQIEAKKTRDEKGVWADADKELPIKYEPGEPCKVKILADSVQHEHWERATIIGLEARDGVEGGFVYQTSKTGKTWITAARLEKWGTTK